MQISSPSRLEVTRIGVFQLKTDGDVASFSSNSSTAGFVHQCTFGEIFLLPQTARPSPWQPAPGQKSLQRAEPFLLRRGGPGSVSSWVRNQARSSLSMPCVMGTSELILCSGDLNSTRGPLFCFFLSL